MLYSINGSPPHIKLINWCLCIPMGMQHLYEIVEPLIHSISSPLCGIRFTFAFLLIIFIAACIQPCQIDFVIQPPHSRIVYSFFSYFLFFHLFRILSLGSTPNVCFHRSEFFRKMNEISSKPKTFIRLMDVWFYSELICFTPLRQIVYWANSETHNVKNQPNAMSSVFYEFLVCGICQFFVYLLNRNDCGCPRSAFVFP